MGDWSGYLLPFLLLLVLAAPAVAPSRWWRWRRWWRVVCWRAGGPVRAWRRAWLPICDVRGLALPRWSWRRLRPVRWRCAVGGPGWREYWQEHDSLAFRSRVIDFQIVKDNRGYLYAHKRFGIPYTKEEYERRTKKRRRYYGKYRRHRGYKLHRIYIGAAESVAGDDLVVICRQLLRLRGDVPPG